MKLSVLIFSIALCSLSFAINAALPPLYDSINEYKALLNDPELARKLNSAEGIQEIERTENGFIITTLRYTLQIDRVQEPQSQPGPAKFHFIFYDAEKRE